MFWLLSHQILKFPTLLSLYFYGGIYLFILSFFFFKPESKYLFIYLFMAVLDLRFCARAFSSCGERGPLFITVRGPLSFCRAQAPDAQAQAYGPSCSAACGIFPDQDSNPCPLHWQADSQPLRHQGSPHPVILIIMNFLVVGISLLNSISLDFALLTNLNILFFW